MNRLKTFIVLLFTCFFLLGNSAVANASVVSGRPDNNAHLTTVTVAPVYAYNDFTVYTTSCGFDISCDASWIGFYQKSFTTTAGKFNTVKVLFTPTDNNGSTTRVANVTITFRDDSDINKTFQIVQEPKATGIVTVSPEYTYRDFTVYTYSGGFDITCDQSWISFYQKSFTTTAGKLNTVKVLFMPKENTGDTKREANVTITFKDKDSRDANYTFKIIQDAYPKFQVPTIKISGAGGAEVEYKTPTATNGVVRINYDKDVYTVAYQTITFLDKEGVFEIISHKATPVKIGGQEYLNTYEERCDVFYPVKTCNESKHTLKCFGINYPTLNGNVWTISPEVDITLKYKDCRDQEIKTANYRVRFTKMRLAVDPSIKPGATTAKNEKKTDSNGTKKCIICCTYVTDLEKHIASRHCNYGTNWGSAMYSGQDGSSKTLTQHGTYSLCPYCAGLFFEPNTYTEEGSAATKNKTLEEHIKTEHPYGYYKYCG